MYTKKEFKKIKGYFEYEFNIKITSENFDSLYEEIKIYFTPSIENEIDYKKEKIKLNEKKNMITKTDLTSFGGYMTALIISVIIGCSNLIPSAKEKSGFIIIIISEGVFFILLLIGVYKYQMYLDKDTNLSRSFYDLCINIIDVVDKEEMEKRETARIEAAEKVAVISNSKNVKFNEVFDGILSIVKVIGKIKRKL